MYLPPFLSQKRAFYIDHPECNGQIGLRHSVVDRDPGSSSACAQVDLCLATGADDVNVRRTMVVQMDGDPQLADADDCGHG
jgi:hypothetical protein